MPAILWDLFEKRVFKGCSPCPRSICLSHPHRLSRRWTTADPARSLPLRSPLRGPASSRGPPPSPRRIPRSRPAVPAARPLPFSRRPWPPLRGGHRLRGRGTPRPPPPAPSAPAALYRRSSSLPPAVCRRSGHVPVPPWCSAAPAGASPVALRLRARPLRSPGGCRLGARPRALPARPEGNAPARSWRCGRLPRLRGTSGSTVCGKVVCLPGERRGGGVRRRGGGGKPPPKTAYMNFQALDLPPRSAQ